MARARRRWIREQGWLDTTRLVFLDETAVTTNMVRLNGWSPCGERLVADAPMGHWETVTFIAGLRQTGIVAPMVIKGAMNGEAFLAYIEQCLAPTLKRGDIVVADNVSFHKVAGIEEALRGVGASLRYLPQYSPDLNPIELVFHPVKTFLRKAAERTIEGLQRRIGSFIRTLDPSECMRYFRHAGYDPLRLGRAVDRTADGVKKTDRAAGTWRGERPKRRLLFDDHHRDRGGIMHGLLQHGPHRKPRSPLERLPRRAPLRVGEDDQLAPFLFRAFHDGDSGIANPHTLPMDDADVIEPVGRATQSEPSAIPLRG